MLFSIPLPPSSLALPMTASQRHLSAAARDAGRPARRRRGLVEGTPRRLWAGQPGLALPKSAETTNTAWRRPAWRPERRCGRASRHAAPVRARHRCWRSHVHRRQPLSGYMLKTSAALGGWHGRSPGVPASCSAGSDKRVKGVGGSEECAHGLISSLREPSGSQLGGIQSWTDTAGRRCATAWHVTIKHTVHSPTMLSHCLGHGDD
ncbi:hypothetical protein P154DRAFT_64179 [Amniculicola lignicola CBS 123094]|uniref:Uncharacterized protein n=1 Tax=Amniculicola lignicola CBS 123094 TaxID=1392246 RepID=A0A6A5WY31_9PLEO|nr:hypothetical protein P154DRAFT_64179 [Amniculicola lignicola CBS 123094]